MIHPDDFPPRKKGRWNWGILTLMAFGAVGIVAIIKFTPMILTQLGMQP